MGSLANIQRSVLQTDAPTRELFMDFSLPMELAFYVLATITILIFFYGVYQRYARYRQGAPDDARLRNVPGQLIAGLKTVLSGRTIFKRDAYAGTMHIFVLYGFIALFIATALIAIESYVFGITGTPVKIALEAIGLEALTAEKGTRVFWEGSFYLGYQFAVDILGALFVIGVAMAMVRRWSFDLFKLDLSRVDDKDDDRSNWILDDWVFLGFLFVIGVTGFILEGARLAAAPTDGVAWYINPVGEAFAVAMSAVYAGENMMDIYPHIWWFHGIISLAFIAYIPYSKAVHMFTSLLSLSFHDDMSGRKLPSIPEDRDNQGYADIEDFTWKHLLDGDACTKCGRCHDVCPAREAGTDLSPRDIILDVRKSLAADGGVQMADGEISQDRLWACTTCRACMEECPVGIEHIPQIVEMRRELVAEGEVGSNVQDTLMDLMQRDNSFGSSAKKRAMWSRELDFKPTDAREESVEYLWYVGDYASYDDRMQARTRRVATLFEEAGVDFGILYEDEANDGNDARRIGEEGLFEMLAEKNIETMEKCEFDSIVTTDPHALNTLQNEYPELDFEEEVIHYSTLLEELVESGDVAVSGDLAGETATYHDPCYLGRYNGVFEAPRNLIEATGMDLAEMERNRDNSFCCGAGGGRIYMDTSDEEERPSNNRIEEALDLGADPDYFVVSCPKDMAMFDDAVKNFDTDMEVVDLIDLVTADVSTPDVSVDTPVAAD